MGYFCILNMGDKLISKNVHNPDNNKHMVQYGIWSDCCNSCDFCLRLNRENTSNATKVELLRDIRENIRYIDWKGKFAYGISLLGGELFYVRNKQVQQEFLNLIDDIIEVVLKPNDTSCKFSTVTNGLYDPTFLYQVMDKLKDSVGMERVDVNFSYDLKHRYKNEQLRKTAFDNINNFHKRYNYSVGVQMILTQHVINLWKSGQFDVNDFIDQNFPGCSLCLLYPHPVHTGKVLDDFYFNRKDFLDFMKYLKYAHYGMFLNFINSVKNSSTFKYTGMRDKGRDFSNKQQPILSDGKEILNPKCGHSTLYQCYSDCDKCILCDLKLIDNEL